MATTNGVAEGKAIGEGAELRSMSPITSALMSGSNSLRWPVASRSLETLAVAMIAAVAAIAAALSDAAPTGTPVWDEILKAAFAAVVVAAASKAPRWPV